VFVLTHTTSFGLRHTIPFELSPNEWVGDRAVLR